MIDQEKTYEATIEVLLPSNQKVTSYKLTVKAGDPVEATARAIAAWDDATSAKDIRVKELTATSRVVVE